jgi:type II secretion system protein H
LTIGRTRFLRPWHTRRAAFTLLELILVMMIMCTVLAMAGPSLRGFFASRQTADAAAQFVTLARYARSQAIAEGRVYRLNFDVQAGTYWLTAQESGTFANIASDFGRTFSLPTGTTMNLEEPAEVSARGYLRFEPTGRAETAKLQLTGKDGEVVRIACDSPSELFRIVKAEGNPP